MRMISYYGYTVVANAANCENGLWQPVARVFWSTGEEELTPKTSISFNSEADAETHAVEMGKHWVNNRLQIKMYTTIVNPRKVS